MKVFKLNNKGASGVGVTKELKAAGYLVGMEVAWIKAPIEGEFILRKIKAPVVASVPLSPKVEPTVVEEKKEATDAV